jgi:hypothetical protein
MKWYSAFWEWTLTAALKGTTYTVQRPAMYARPHWGYGFDTRYECSECFLSQTRSEGSTSFKMPRTVSSSKIKVRITLRRIRVTIVAMEQQCVTYSEFVCNLSYLAWQTYAPYCHLWPFRLYRVFPHYFINDTIFGTKLLNIRCVLLFSATFI